MWIKSLPDGKSPGYQRELRGLVQERHGLALVGIPQDRKLGANEDLAELIPAIRTVDVASDFHLQVGIVEFGILRHGAKCSREATCYGAQQEVFRGPSAFQTTVRGGRGEVDGVQSGSGFRNTGAARSPPRDDAKLMQFCHQGLTPIPGNSCKSSCTSVQSFANLITATGERR